MVSSAGSSSSCSTSNKSPVPNSPPISSEVVNWSGATFELLSEIPESVRRESSSMTISGSSCSETSLNSLFKSTSPLSSCPPTSGVPESAAGLSSLVSIGALLSSLAILSELTGCSVSPSSFSKAGPSSD